MGELGRRSFLARLAAAAAGVASMGMVDPDRLLWTPGTKTIIDLGATKQVLPVTDREIVQLDAVRQDALREARGVLLTGRERRDRRLIENFAQHDRQIKLEIFDPQRQELRAFRYVGDDLVGHYTPADLALLDAPFMGRKGTR